MYKYFISAPGANIESTTWAGSTKYMTGTSFAAPTALGAYALLRDYILIHKSSEYDLQSFEDQKQLTMDTLDFLRRSARRGKKRGNRLEKEETRRGILDLEKA